jgi:hypothetical protein
LALQVQQRGKRLEFGMQCLAGPAPVKLIFADRDVFILLGDRRQAQHCPVA